MRLEGRKALVTGASRGIGREIALGLAREGADLIVNYNQSQDKASEVVKEIKALGREAIALRADVGRSQEVIQMIKDSFSAFGRIDILVNNAGIAVRSPFLDITEDIWDLTLNVDLKGTFLCSQAVAKEMVRSGGGKIINVSSISAEVGTSTYVHYCTAKGGVNALTKAMAVALAPCNIQVNAIAPGVIETEAVKNLFQNPANRDPVLTRTPAGKVGQCGDCVGAVVFLASKGSDHITGEIITIDGGYVLQGPEWAEV